MAITIVPFDRYFKKGKMKNYLLYTLLMTCLMSCSHKHITEDNSTNTSDTEMTNQDSIEYIDNYIVFLTKGKNLDDLNIPSDLQPLFVKKLSSITNSWLIDLSTVKSSERAAIVKDIRNIDGIKSMIADGPLEPR